MQRGGATTTMRYDKPPREHFARNTTRERSVSRDYYSLRSVQYNVYVWHRRGGRLLVNRRRVLVRQWAADGGCLERRKRPKKHNTSIVMSTCTSIYYNSKEWRHSSSNHSIRPATTHVHTTATATATTISPKNTLSPQLL